MASKKKEEDLALDKVPQEMIDFNAMYLGLKIKNLLMMETVSKAEVDHICKQLNLGLAVEKYLNHEDYYLREILNE